MRGEPIVKRKTPGEKRGYRLLLVKLQQRRAGGIWFQMFRPYVELKQRMSTMFWSQP